LSAQHHGDLEHLLRKNAANLTVWILDDVHEQMVPWSFLQVLQMNVYYAHQQSYLWLHLHVMVVPALYGFADNIWLLKSAIRDHIVIIN
jgi:hypothetical protein